MYKLLGTQNQVLVAEVGVAAPIKWTICQIVMDVTGRLLVAEVAEEEEEWEEVVAEEDLEPVEVTEAECTTVEEEEAVEDSTMSRDLEEGLVVGTSGEALTIEEAVVTSPHPDKTLHSEDPLMVGCLGAIQEAAEAEISLLLLPLASEIQETSFGEVVVVEEELV